MRSINRKFYDDKEWEKCRAAYFIHVGGLCERCKAKGIITPGDIVHHKIHLNEDNVHDPAVAYNFDNLELLCQRCHNEEHFGKAKAKKRYQIDAEGNLVIGTLPVEQK